MIFLDSGNIKEIKKFNELGIIRGCTTNPSIMLRDKIKDIDKAVLDISKEIFPYPLSVEVTSNDESEMLKQAYHFSEINDNVNIKIPIHGPKGELYYLMVIEELSSDNIVINATAMMNASQMLLAALAGARYVSLFAGRVNDMGVNALSELKKIWRLIDRFDLDAYIICGSVREPLNVIEWLQFADIITVPPTILEKMILHSRTKETVQTFINDAQKLQGNSN